MAVKIKKESGKTVTLLNPSEKLLKYSRELKRGVREINDRKFKLDKNGKAQRLNEEQKAYRAGYIAHAKDSAGAYKHNNKKTPSKRK